MFNFLKRRRRRQLRALPFPEKWSQVLEGLPLYKKISVDDRRELRGHIQVFLAEKNIEGCGGIEITDQIRVTIAAQACLLLLHRHTDYYPDTPSVLVYPGEYVTPARDPDLESSPRIGEAWPDGKVVLSWDDMRNDIAEDDRYNVVFHEFAHLLDMESGAADGTPTLASRDGYSAWGRVLGEEYADLQSSGARRSSALDTYGAEHPAEFFAVATESFFGDPKRLRDRHPELYEELRRYYNQDPASWG